jgi:putative membrane protein
MKRALRIGLLLAGLALFALFVVRAGPAEIWRTCAALGWMAPLMLVPYGLVYACDTLGWRFAFPAQGGDRVRFARLFKVRWCGEAVNNVVPSGTVGGEAIKVYLLRRKGVAPEDTAASVLIGRTVQTLTQVLFVAVGAAAFLSFTRPDSALHRAMMLVLGGATAVAGLMLWLQRRGFFRSLLAALECAGVRIAALEGRRDALLEVDQLITGFYRGRRRRFAASAAAYLCGWLLDTTDVWLAAWLLHHPVAWTQALAIEAFIGVAKILGLLVPGALGVQESGITLVCRLAGLPDSVGVSYALLRRGREVLYAAVGWCLLYAGESGLGALPWKLSQPQHRPT